MSQVIRIPEHLYARLEEHAHGFDTPANVIERILNYYEQNGTEAPETRPLNPEKPSALATSLDLTYRPSGEENFKRALLEKKQAYIRLYKMDGSSEVKVWNASKFSPDSSVNANLRSGYLRNWKKKGIFKAVIAVDEADIA
jgi:hypothetical protein